MPPRPVPAGAEASVAGALVAREEGPEDVQTGADIELVQWLRFGTGAYLRILGFAPKDKWADMFTRFRAVRDGLEPR